MPYTEYLARWTPRDRAIVAAVLMEKSDRCVSCGSASWEWREDQDAWVAVEEVCMGCARKDQLRAARDADRQTGQTASVPGQSIRLVKAAYAAALTTVKASRPKSRREIAKEREAT